MRALGRVLFAVATTTALPACGRRDCNCTSPPAITITAPAGLIADVTLSGSACDGLYPACAMTSTPDYPPGCATTLVFPRNAGECAVDITLRDGRVVRRVVALAATSDDCCTMILPASPDGGAIDLAIDAALD